MLLYRLQLLLVSFGGALLLLLLLCLGAQNLQDRHSIRIADARSAAMPTGFLVGISLILGVISGGSTAAVLMPDQRGTGASE